MCVCAQEMGQDLPLKMSLQTEIPKHTRKSNAIQDRKQNKLMNN